MSFLTKEQMLGPAANTMPTEVVSVPELDGELTVRGLSVAQRDRIIKETTIGKGKKARTDVGKLRPLLVARTVIDENGERLFSDADARALADTRGDALERVFSVAARLSGLLDAEDEEEADEPEDGSEPKKS